MYRAHGFWVPPNTTSQFKKTTRVRSGKELQPGDVVFLADPKKSNRIFHIMLYLGNGNLIESIGSSPHNSVKQVKNAHDMKVRKVSIVERLGMPLEKVFSGKQYQAKDLSSIRTCTVFLGAFFKTKDDLKKMRQLERCPTPQAL